jgi:hypothetical protein
MTTIFEQTERLSPSIEMVANNNLRTVATTFQGIRNSYEISVRRLWENQHYSPQEILDELGENAVELIEYHEKLCAFLNNCVDGCTQQCDEKVLDYTKNEDGTITVNPVD